MTSWSLNSHPGAVSSGKASNLISLIRPRQKLQGDGLPNGSAISRAPYEPAGVGFIALLDGAVERANLLTDVEKRAVRVHAVHRKLRVVIVDEPFGGGDPFKDRVRRSHQVAADNKNPSLPI